MVTYEVNCTLANFGTNDNDLKNLIAEVSMLCHINVKMF
jgi:hypothetical protein